MEKKDNKQEEVTYASPAVKVFCVKPRRVLCVSNEQVTESEESPW